MKERISIKDIVEIMAHVDRMAKEVCHGEIKDQELIESVYEDIYKQGIREDGSWNIEFVKPHHLYAIHEAIDAYVLPAVLLEKITEEKKNAENNSTNGNHELD